MVIQVNVPEGLLAQAQARGVPLEAYIQEILAASSNHGLWNETATKSRTDSRVA